MPTFEEILAEADATIAKARAKVKGKSVAQVARVDDPARANLYIPHRNVYSFYDLRCSCGSCWEELDGIYEERRHPVLAHTHWLRLSAVPTNSLPREIERKEVLVPYCKECANATPKVS